MSRKPQNTATDPNQPATKPVFIVPWASHGYGYDDDGYREWAVLEPCGYSFHQNKSRIARFLRAYRQDHEQEFEQADFPHYVAVPHKDWWYGHNIPVHQLQLPLSHSFHRVAERNTDGVYLDKYMDRKDLKTFFMEAADPRPATAKEMMNVVESTIMAQKTRPRLLPYTVFWPEQRTPDIW